MKTTVSQSIRRLTMAGVLAAAIILLTAVVSMPMPGGFGYINLGDAGVLLAGMLLGGWWGALCAGAASALADLLLGYGVYAPATFVIKGLVALVGGVLFARAGKRARFFMLYPAALIVPLGYFLYESLLYSASSALANIAFNTLQCLVGAGVATALGVVLLKTNVFAEFAARPAAEVLREPKNGPEVILIANREHAALIQKAGDLLSVQGITARLVAVDDERAFDRLPPKEKDAFLPQGMPFVRVEGTENSAQSVMQAALQALSK